MASAGLIPDPVTTTATSDRRAALEALLDLSSMNYGKLYDLGVSMLGPGRLFHHTEFQDRIKRHVGLWTTPISQIARDVIIDIYLESNDE